jgi:predicted transglutaminase-like cysteine proteinase
MRLRLITATLALCVSAADAMASSKERWDLMLSDQEGKSSQEKLRAVNAFFNSEVLYDTDKSVYGVKDYWATPVESLNSGLGDCEDYAIAKYFSLLRIGIPRESLRLVYVKAKGLRTPHMVLAYYADHDPMPRILDNMTSEILPAAERKDLTPVYSISSDQIFTGISRTKSKAYSKLPAPWISTIARASRDGSLGDPSISIAGSQAN